MPILLFNKAQNQPVEVPEADVGAALASGNFLIDLDADYNMVGGEGDTIGSVKGANVMDALKRGYRLETPEESKRRAYTAELETDIEGRHKAALAGVGRGLTLGLSDLVMTKSGLVDPEYLEALRQWAPGVSTASEVGGNVLGALATGGGSLGLKAAAKFVPAAGASALGRAAGGWVEGQLLGQATKNMALRHLTGEAAELAAKQGLSIGRQALAKGAAFAAGGVVEGSLIGVGQAITEEALGDPRDMGELLVASVGPNALIGGIAGGLFGGGSVLGGRALKKFTAASETMIAKGVNELAPSVRILMAAKSLGLDSEALRRSLGEKKFFAGIDALFDPTLLDDGLPLVRPGAKTPEVVERVAEAVERAGKNVDTVIAGLDDEVVPHLSNLPQKPGLVQEGFVPESMFDPMRDLPNKKRIAEALNKIADESEIYAGGKNARTRQGYRELKRIANEFAGDETPFMYFREGQAQKVGYGTAFDQRVARGSRDWAHRDVYKVISRELETSAEAMLQKIERPEVFDIYKKSKEVYYALADMSEVASGKMQEASLAYARMVGQAGHDFFKGMQWRVLTGRTVIGGATASATMTAAKLGADAASSVVRPSRIAGWASNAGMLRSIQTFTQKFASRVERSVDSLLNLKKMSPVSASIPALRILNDITGKQDEQEAWRAYRAKVQILSDPNKLTQRIAMSMEGLEEAAPGISVEASLALTRAAQVIQAAMPAPENVSTLQPDLDDFVPEPTDMGVFRNVVAAVMKPESMLEDLATGTLTPEAVDAVAQVYPRFLELLKQTIVEKLSVQKEKLPYNMRVQLSILFGLPTDPTLDDDFIQRSQSVWASQRQQQENAQPKGSPPKFTESDTKLHRTTSQRIEGGVG